MQFFSIEQFLAFPKHGYIFFFSMENYCGLCKQYKQEIEKYNIKKLIEVKAESEDELMSLGIKALPCTRIYDTQDKVCYEKYGVLYEKQVEILLNEFSNG